jgi:antidote-toxin recognition MazE-like antitoxin
VKAQVLNKPKHDTKLHDAKVRDKQAEALTLNGIPLRRKTVWAIDTDSPEFRAARKRDAKALRKKADNGDGLQFIEAVLAEKDVQKWWN